MRDQILDFCNNKEVFCYGAGEYGRVAKRYLQTLGINISGFVVSRKDNEEASEVLGVPVYSFPDFPYDYEKCAFVVSLSESLHGSISDSLKRAGCRDILLLTAAMVAGMRREIDTERLTIDRSGVLVLLYHRIADLRNDVWSLATPIALFEEQMRYIKESYHVVRMEDDWERVEDRSVVITFDDGYIDNYITAFPVLKKYNLPATYYICTGNVDSEREFWWDELESILAVSGQGDIETCRKKHAEFKRMDPTTRKTALAELARYHGISLEARKDRRSMRSEEIRELAQSDIITIGAHTVTHSALANLGEDEIMDEVVTSKTLLEKIIGREVMDFSYPFGNASDRGEKSGEILKQAGFRTIATTAGGVVRRGCVNKYAIPRNTILPSVASMEDFKRFLDITYAVSDGIIV